jgi:predicted DNA-binding transcriptional regulator AlpA
MPEPLLTTLEAATYLHLSPKTLEKWRVVGGGPRYRKLGHRVVYTQQDIDTWVEDKARTSTSDPGPPPPTPRAAVHALSSRRRWSRAPH